MVHVSMLHISRVLNKLRAKFIIKHINFQFKPKDKRKRVVHYAGYAWEYQELCQTNITKIRSYNYGFQICKVVIIECNMADKCKCNPTNFFMTFEIIKVT